MGVSKNRGTRKSSFLIRFSLINHPFWGTPVFGNTQIKKHHIGGINFKKITQIFIKNPTGCVFPLWWILNFSIFIHNFWWQWLQVLGKQKLVIWAIWTFRVLASWRVPVFWRFLMILSRHSLWAYKLDVVFMVSLLILETSEHESSIQLGLRKMADFLEPPGWLETTNVESQRAMLVEVSGEKFWQYTCGKFIRNLKITEFLNYGNSFCKFNFSRVGAT